jgi:hypothetical protein
MPPMKFFNAITIALLFFTANAVSAQAVVSQIYVGSESFYITNKIGYDVEGIYLFEGKTNPTVELSEAGFGVVESEDLTKKNIVWGIQCSKSGTPTFKKGFDSVSYVLWYKDTSEEENHEEKWIKSHFSIHFRVKKMFVFGNRSKTYVDKKY